MAAIHAAGFDAVALAAARELRTHLRSGRVVDLGCGAGTLLAQLPRKFDKIGMDVSPAMLELARLEVPEGTFFEASATTDQIPKCDAITAVGEVFSFAAGQEGREAVAAAWTRMHSRLTPGGLLLFDVASHGRAPQRTHAAASGKGWKVEATSIEDGDRLIRTIDTWTDSGHTQEVHQLALLDEAWVLEHLEAAGFTVEPTGAYDDHALQIGWDAYLAWA